MNKEERVIKLINKEEVDYLPSQIVFSDKSRLKKLSESMGFRSVEEFDHYLENHLHYSYPMEDWPMYYRNDDDLMKEAEKKGFCKLDWQDGIVFNNWGEGYKRYEDGFWDCFHPLSPAADKKKYEKFMPENILESYYEKDITKAIQKYKAPDINIKDNFSMWDKDYIEKSGDYLVIPTKYWGIFERAHAILGFQEFMLLLASEPDDLGVLLDKITDHNIEIAKEIVKKGFKIAHYGDDLGNQTSTFFSPEMFRRILKPRIKRLWSIYKDAGIPVYMHCCGNITKIIPDLIEIGLDVLEPMQPVMDFKYLKKEFGKDLTFFGGIDTQYLLPFGTPEEIKTQSKEVIYTLGKNGGYIIAPSQEIMADVPIDNIKALVEVINVERKKALDI